MNKIRYPAVAGAFYPADAQQLRQEVEQLLREATSPEKPPKALIAPHAGYIYSGPIAASAYHSLQQARDTIRRVILLGPSHRVPFHGLAASSADEFVTPLGNIPLDRDSIAQALELPQVHLLDEAHKMEHSLEVQLPFLQVTLDHFSLVPLVVGDSEPEEVAQVLELLWGGPETLIVISSDLSHYQTYEAARQLDAHTSKAIESLQPEEIHYHDACGRNPINGLLVTALAHRLKAETIDLRNSGDTAGPRDQVVGYGAWLFH